MAEYDPWETSSGLVDEYIAETVGARFEFDPKYMNGEKLLLKIDFNTGDPDIGEGGIVTEQYPLGGDDWTTNDGGQTATNPKQPNPKINNNSGVGLLMDSVRDAGGRPALAKKGNPWEAAAWIGHKWKMKRKEFKFTDRKTGQENSYARMLVEELADPNTPAAPTATPTSGNPTPAANEAPANPAPTSEAPASAPAATEHVVPALLKVLLKQLAKETATHDEFLEQALTTEQYKGKDFAGPINADEAIVAAVADPEWYEAIKAS